MGLFADAWSQKLRHALLPFKGSYTMTKSWSQLVQSLSDGKADLVLVTEFSPRNDWTSLLDAAGKVGRGIHCTGPFATFMDTKAFDSFFKIINRPTWKRGSYCRTHHALHKDTSKLVLGSTSSSLPISVNAKSQMIAGVASHEVYQRVGGCKALESLFDHHSFSRSCIHLRRMPRRFLWFHSWPVMKWITMPWPLS